MASPGFTRHLNDLIGQFSRLAALMRAPERAMPPASVTSAALSPQKILQHVGRLVVDHACFHQVDVMRRYRWDIPQLCVDEVLLVSALTEVVRMAIMASGPGGAVVCDLYYDDNGLRFSISDSSGVTGQAVHWWEGCNRYRILSRLEGDVAALGGKLLMAVFEGEGVVVELLFAPALCLGNLPRTARARNG